MRWQLQLLFFFGISDVVFGVASIGSSSLAIIGDPRHRARPKAFRAGTPPLLVSVLQRLLLRVQPSGASPATLA
jgi:hypothetical protein